MVRVEKFRNRPNEPDVAVLPRKLMHQSSNPKVSRDSGTGYCFREAGQCLLSKFRVTLARTSPTYHNDLKDNGNKHTRNQLWKDD